MGIERRKKLKNYKKFALKIKSIFILKFILNFLFFIKLFFILLID
jgi:hypothetical protein